MKTIAYLAGFILCFLVFAWLLNFFNFSNSESSSNYDDIASEQNLAYEDVPNIEEMSTSDFLSFLKRKETPENKEDARMQAILKRYEQQIQHDPNNLRLLWAIADVYYSLQDYQAAVQYYRQALKLDPKNLKLKISLANAYLNTKDVVHSEELFKEVSQIEPNNPNILAGLGRVEALRHNILQAEDLYFRSLEKDPKNFSTLYYLAELRIEQKRYHEALDILKKLQARDPKARWINQALNKAKTGPILEEGKRLEAQGNVPFALEFYRKQIANDPTNLELYLALNKFYTKLGNYSKAIAVLNQGLNVYPNSNSLLLALGFTYLDQRDLLQAEFFLELVNRREDGQSEAQAGLGRIAELRGDIQQAEDRYQYSIQLNPLNTLPLSYLANLRIKQKRYDEAIELLEKIYYLDPDATWSLQLIEEAKMAPLLDEIHQWEKSGQYAKAGQLYMQLLIQYPYHVSNYLNFGQLYLNQKLYQEAIEIYLLGLRSNPNAIPLYVALGYAYLLNDELEKSFKAFSFVLDHDSENKDALIGIGRLEAAIGNIQASYDIYQQVLQTSPNDITALSYLSDLELAQKNYEDAQKLYERIIKIDPKARWAQQLWIRAAYGPLFDEIETLKKQERFDEVILAYQELLDLAPHSEEAYLGLGQIYNAQKRYQDAIKLYKKGLTYEPSSTILLVRLGLAYLETGSLEQAYKILESARQSDPKNAEAIAGIGRIAALMGDTSRAIELYEEALKANPQDMLALSYYADLWMSQKEFSKAEQIYQRIVQLYPEAIWAQNALLDAKYAPLLLEIKEKEETKSFQEAEELYLQLIAQAPGQINYYIKLGQLYTRMKQFDKAISVYLKALDIQPRSIELKIALAFAYLEKGQLNPGREILEEVLKENAENAEALAGIGFFYQLSGEPEAAQYAYEKALAIDSHNLSALILFAKLMMEQKRYDEAQNLYKEIYRLDPSAKWVKLAIEDAKHGRLMDQIQKLEDAKDEKAAELLWKQLLLEAPDVSDYYLRMGFFYQRILQYQKAINTYFKGLDIDPESAELYAALGLAYLSLKDSNRAEKSFRMALKFDARNPDALAGLGYVAFLNDNFEVAEALIQKALSVDPNRIAALSALGELRMKEKKYSEAVKVYEKLKFLRPKEKWISLSLDDAKYGSTLDEIQELVAQNEFSTAAQAYLYLLQQSPNNPRYYFGLGQMYMRLKEYGRSIETNLEGLQKNPDENELRVALGYAYFFNGDLLEAREVLEKAVEIDEKNPEALAGLGRVNFLEKNYCIAELLYKRALSIEPKNQSALSFLSDLLMKQKRYAEAEEVFASLWRLLPDAEWVKRSWQDARDGPMTDLANCYADREEYELAAAIYCQLVELSPNDPARYLPLGQMYVNLQQYERGIEIYRQGLAEDPEAWYLWRAIAFAYIQTEDYCISQSIFLSLIESDPDDAEAWAGLGRIEALNGSVCLAKYDYDTSLGISSNNLTTLSFLADLYKFEHYYFSALAVNEQMVSLNDEFNELTGSCSQPKWLKRSYQDILNLTWPTLAIAAGYHEENQWDPTVDKWSARYSVYGASALINYPIHDQLTLWGKVEDKFFVLKDLLTHTYLYSFDVQRVYAGSQWVYSPCLYIDAFIGLTNYSQYHESSFKLRKGTIKEPSLTFTYQQPTEKLTLSFSSGSDLVARDFEQNVAKLVGYYFILGTYERKLCKRTWAGIEADTYWYYDFVNNSSRRVLGWIQWRPPYYSDNILFRYHIKYQTFDKNIPDYYTYKPQIVNQLQVTLQKNWRVCWADTFYTSLSYGHGWQNTRTRFAQIIVVTDPLGAVNPPYQWDNRQYNIFFGNLIYKRNQLQLGLNADYYRDTEKYTIWSVRGEAIWRF